MHPIKYSDMKLYIMLILFTFPYWSFSQENKELKTVYMTLEKSDIPVSDQTIQIVIDETSQDNQVGKQKSAIKVESITLQAKKAPELNKKVEIQKVSNSTDEINSDNTTFTVQYITLEKSTTPQNVEIKIDEN
jgi:hypothetical protein